jgi:RNA polymerase sigma-70 factor, ECF subfamily
MHPPATAGSHHAPMLRLPRPWRDWLAWLIERDGDIAAAVSGPEIELVERAQRGDPQAFELLLRARGARLLGTARKVLRDPDQAEDAVQQAVITAWRMLPRLREPERFDGWLYKVVVNACYAEANRHRRFLARVARVTAEPTGGDPSREIDEREALDQAFRTLSPAHRAVVVLHYYAGLPLTEVARVVGVGPGTVRSRLHYALRALRAVLDAQDRPSIEELAR